MSSPRRVLLGVSGGIAAIKTPLLASHLVQAGYEVEAVLTTGAQAFIQPLALAAITGRPVWTDRDFLVADGSIRHVDLARRCQLAVVAPASAAFLAHLAQGDASSLLVAALLGLSGRLYLAPAMEEEMWQHPAVQANVDTLVSRGAQLIGPVAGRLASGAHGVGRMSEVDQIVAAVQADGHGSLGGRRVLITAGPTREHIDDVRFLSNGSTGKMGLAMATAARDQGAMVTLVLGPTHLAAPSGVEVVAVESAQQMFDAVTERFAQSDVVVGVAAVADIAPAQRTPGKAAKGAFGETLTIKGTPDIMAWAGAHRDRQVLIGFAAQVGMDEVAARAKLDAKGLDWIVLNDLSEAGAGFGSDTNHVLVLAARGVRHEARGSKRQVADAIWSLVGGTP
ncbi:MAG: bifunctional phosphopantothenoylcysteine decarboxylase/phosphopantothenate--cysteine ligase CoaBC [Sulfobacillus sp.]